MKILIAPDSFKESLTATEAARAMAAGVRRLLPKAQILLLPIADGGEGTVDALMTAQSGEYIDSWVQGPLGNQTKARWGILPNGTGVIEMASASGLPLVPPPQRNPLLASTYGTGQLLRSALDRGCRRIIVGLGGSATSDGGAGALAALGVSLLDSKGREITPNPQGLMDLHTIDIDALDPRWQECQIELACDVENPLLGPLGAAAVYGPQKGASTTMVTLLEQALTRFAAAARQATGKDIASFPGSGAAGGLAAGLSLIPMVNLRPGIELVLETVDFTSHLNDAAIVLTGEGQIDSQSAMGKALAGIAGKTKEQGVPLIALCGTLGAGYENIYPAGVTAVQPIVPGPISKQEAMDTVRQLLEAATDRALRIFLAGYTCCSGRQSNSGK